MASNTKIGPGSGRYTVYVPPKSMRRTFFEKLFRGDGSPFEAVVGSTGHPAPYIGMDQNDAIAQAALNGNNILRAAATDGIITGDPGYFPEGVDLKFTGRGTGTDIPDFAKGADGLWKQPGDPANSYVPDLSSPGPGRTQGTDKDVDPKIKANDLKPAYIPGAPGTSTKSPSQTSGKLYEAQKLGTFLKKGSSGGDA
jgi:hypothetical protein